MSHKGDGLSTVARRTTTREIGGRTVEISQLTLKDLITLREKACDEYKRSMLKTFTENRDILGGIDLDSKIAEIAAITPDDLPPRKAWAAERDEDGKIVRSTLDRYWHKGAKAWVSRGDPVPKEQELPYEMWWSQTRLGQLHSLWLSMRHCPGQQNWTLDDVVGLIQDDGEAARLADDVGMLSAARLGEVQPAAQAT